MGAKDSFTLQWCAKHNNWWVTNCPDCMVDSNEPEIKEAGRQEVVDYIEEQNDLEDEEPLPYYVMNKKVWQAQKKEWGL